MKSKEDNFIAANIRLPPRGGSGLKFWKAVALEHIKGLPPRGGSGLKSKKRSTRFFPTASPSARREWVEIRKDYVLPVCNVLVSLREEGVG